MHNYVFVAERKRIGFKLVDMKLREVKVDKDKLNNLNQSQHADREPQITSRKVSILVVAMRVPQSPSVNDQPNDIIHKRKA